MHESHELYKASDFTDGELERSNTLAEVVVEQGLSVCKKCGEHWGTLSEYEIIKDCETCKTGEFICHYTDMDDTFKAIEKLSQKEAKG